jgi:hypothetical protein
LIGLLAGACAAAVPVTSNTVAVTPKTSERRNNAGSLSTTANQ